MKLHVGDWVRVRSHAEILATLDERGCLEGLPFMPQMVPLCGKRFQVSKRAHKFCDFGPDARRMTDAVFLDDIRCDGATYGGCEMDCLIVWKTAWLQPSSAAADVPEPAMDHARSEALHTLALAGTRRPEVGAAAGSERFACQATELPVATTAQSVWDYRQYIEDYRSGNASLTEIVTVLFLFLYEKVATSGLGLGWFMRSAWDLMHRISGSVPYPYRKGKLPNKSRTPTTDLGIRPGEFVRIKTYDEVLQTVTEDLSNRGMNFAPEMVQYCGKSFRVSRRLSRIMNERTGHILELKNQCLVLEGAGCPAHFARPLLCPRGMSPYWREIWLERVDKAAGDAPTT